MVFQTHSEVLSTVPKYVTVDCLFSNYFIATLYIFHKFRIALAISQPAKRNTVAVVKFAV